MPPSLPQNSAKTASAVPLAVDFDGTMHRGDLNWMGFRWLLVAHPWAAADMLFKLAFVSRPAMKMALQAYALRWRWQPRMLWDNRVLDLMAEAETKGRELLVATGSPTHLVKAILQQHGLHYDVMGTESLDINLVKANKGAALVRRWGERGFDYAGNSPDDLAVWALAREALVVNAPARVLQKARLGGNVGTVLLPENRPLANPYVKNPPGA